MFWLIIKRRTINGNQDDKRLREIQDDILIMGSMVTKATMLAIEALQNRDLALAKQIIADDDKINRKRFDIEEKCIQLIATQQPMASDLRTIVAVLNIITELEIMQPVMPRSR